MNKKQTEKLSSAYTLSDMEIFIFPELFYPLVLANIMSPIIWSWRDDPWFKDIEKKSFTYKVNRIKQYIIDNFVFNLDLSTWGLTTKEKEIARFSDFFDIDSLRQSNALFGYEGDKYYFDIDIRRHFGLDKFTSNIVPYWKTETVEAMTAFRNKPGFFTGAGECVSLSALYSATMFIVGRIPLENIFLIATPLHSQTFINEKEGLITNNRRIVTKNMWFNGTSMSAKARRAIENEKITIVSHVSGYIHTLFDEATIDEKAYNTFASKINDYLTTNLTVEIFINFLRFKSQYKSLFQFEGECSGVKRYLPLEKLFEYEHSSKFQVTPATRDQLIKEIDCDEFHLSQLPNRILLRDAETIIENSNNDLSFAEKTFIEGAVGLSGDLIHNMFEDLSHFIHTVPKLPRKDKKFISSYCPTISVNDSRDEIISKINENIENSETALLSLHVYRQIDKVGWQSFIKAAIERNPVCYDEMKAKSIDELNVIVAAFPDVSIYSGNRLALPDEVWNFKTGDGIEKALLMANFINNTGISKSIIISISGGLVILQSAHHNYTYLTHKNYTNKLTISNEGYSVE